MTGRCCGKNFSFLVDTAENACSISIPDIPFLLLNYSEKSGNMEIVKGSNGDVFFSSQAAELIIDFFALTIAQKNSLRIKAIIIDPGHGGKDPGAIGNYTEDGNQVQLLEKNASDGIYSKCY